MRHPFLDNTYNVNDDYYFIIRFMFKQKSIAYNQQERMHIGSQIRKHWLYVYQANMFLKYAPDSRKNSQTLSILMEIEFPSSTCAIHQGLTSTCVCAHQGRKLPCPGSNAKPASQLPSVVDCHAGLFSEMLSPVRCNNVESTYPAVALLLEPCNQYQCYQTLVHLQNSSGEDLMQKKM